MPLIPGSFPCEWKKVLNLFCSLGLSSSFVQQVTCVWLWFLGWTPSSSVSERLSGWWKDVMKWCDITSVDELTAESWPDATSLLQTDWMIDSQDMQSLINSTHWQKGTLKGHFTGDMCQQFCLENDTLDEFIFYLYKMWTLVTLTWRIVLAVWKSVIHLFWESTVCNYVISIIIFRLLALASRHMMVVKLHLKKT